MGAERQTNIHTCIHTHMPTAGCISLSIAMLKLIRPQMPTASCISLSIAMLKLIRPAVSTCLGFLKLFYEKCVCVCMYVYLFVANAKLL